MVLSFSTLITIILFTLVYLEVEDYFVSDSVFDRHPHILPEPESHHNSLPYPYLSTIYLLSPSPPGHYLFPTYCKTLLLESYLDFQFFLSFVSSYSWQSYLSEVKILSEVLCLLKQVQALKARHSLALTYWLHLKHKLFTKLQSEMGNLCYYFHIYGSFSASFSHLPVHS